MMAAQARPERYPLDDAAFCASAKGYVRGVDRLAPLLQFRLECLDASSAEWRHAKFVHVMLDGMATSIAGQLVARGEKLAFGRPPSPGLIASAFQPADGGDDDHEALSLCQEWCGAIDDVLWFFEAIGVMGSARSQKLLAKALDGLSDEKSLEVLSLHAVRDALGGLRSRMVARLSAADDRYYLKESKKPVMRSPTPLHRLLSAGVLGYSK